MVYYRQIKKERIWLMSCAFKDYPFCTGDCFSCFWNNVIRPRARLAKKKLEYRSKSNELCRIKVKELVDERKRAPVERKGVEVTKNSLYHLLKGMDRETDVVIDFFIKGNWRFSSEGLGLYSVEECLNFLPDDLIASDCDLLSAEGKVKVNVFI